MLENEDFEGNFVVFLIEDGCWLNVGDRELKIYNGFIILEICN